MENIHSTGAAKTFLPCCVLLQSCWSDTLPLGHGGQLCGNINLHS